MARLSARTCCERRACAQARTSTISFARIIFQSSSRPATVTVFGMAAGEKLGAFVELFGNPILSGVGESSSSFDGGFTYLVRPNVQLDAFAGTGLSGDAPDWFAGLGISFRLPR